MKNQSVLSQLQCGPPFYLHSEERRHLLKLMILWQQKRVRSNLSVIERAEMQEKENEVFSQNEQKEQAKKDEMKARTERLKAQRDLLLKKKAEQRELEKKKFNDVISLSNFRTFKPQRTMPSQRDSNLLE
jgi:predicted AlkP superfamily phosphohydrolase/phosphomutase